MKPDAYSACIHSGGVTTSDASSNAKVYPQQPGITPDRILAGQVLVPSCRWLVTDMQLMDNCSTESEERQVLRRRVTLVDRDSIVPRTLGRIASENSPLILPTAVRGLQHRCAASWFTLSPGTEMDSQPSPL